jgi:hypothetical protein
MTGKPKRKHFTLLEVIIATTIFLGLAIVLFVYSEQTTQSWSKVLLRRNQLDELLALDRAANAILPNIIPFTWPDPDEETIVEKPIIVASPDMLRCAYLHRLNDENEGAIRFVEIAVVDGNLIATYAPRPFFDWGDVQNLQDTSILAENVASVSFLYADFSDDETEDWGERLIWVDEWETEESERMDAPLAVCMTVNWNDGKSETWLRRTMGNSFRERFGKWEPMDETRR